MACFASAFLWEGNRPAGAQEHWVFKAIFTDSHFWIPFVVLLLGVGLLIFLR
jgi:hypothetical protein